MPIPSSINFHSQSQRLSLAWGEVSFELSAEMLRVHSPSAEVRGHGKGNEVLQVGKKGVRITKIEPVGNYALSLHFDDGHNTGLFNWDYLKELCENQQDYWQRYLDQLNEAGQSRESAVISFKPVE